MSIQGVDIPDDATWQKIYASMMASAAVWGILETTNNVARNTHLPPELDEAAKSALAAIRRLGKLAGDYDVEPEIGDSAECAGRMSDRALTKLLVQCNTKTEWTKDEIDEFVNEIYAKVPHGYFHGELYQIAKRLRGLA